MKKSVYKVVKICYNNFVYVQLTEAFMQIIKINVGDKLTMKKAHPCGNNTFKVLRVGSDVRIVCLGCSRDLTIDRIKLEKMIKSVTPDGN